VSVEGRPGGPAARKTPARLVSRASTATVVSGGICQSPELERHFRLQPRDGVWEYPSWTLGSTDQKLMLKNFVSARERVELIRSRLFLVPKRTANRVPVIQRPNVSTPPEPSKPPKKRRSGLMNREDNLPPAA
jgi:hypothetical protein